MRLRTQLALALALVALLPVGWVGWQGLSAVTDALETVFDARQQAVRATAEGELARTREAVARAVEDLSSRAPAVAEAARSLAATGQPTRRLVDLGAALLAGSDLDVLFLVDRDGRVVSSGHLPARFGDRAPADLPPPGAAPELQEVEVRDGSGIVRRLALVATARTPDGALTVVGGRQLDGAWVTDLARLTGAEVRLLDGQGQVRAEATGGAGAPEPSDRWRRTTRVNLGEAEGARATLALAVSTRPLARAQRGIRGAVGTAAAAGLVAAVILGLLLAARITRPVGALSRGAARIGAGDYETPVTSRAGGELGGLVRAFNHMAAEILASRERIAAAERIAAWREVARRLAHEIKNPLMPIATSIETLRRARARNLPQFDEIFDEATQAIGEEVEALRRIVDEFSRFARLPAPEPTEVTPEALVEGAAALFPEPPPGIRLERRVAPGLPPVYVDREQLQQVLLNLVTNAVQAIRGASGQGTVTLRAEAGPGPDEVTLAVADDGPGIPPEHLGDLFTPYFTTKEEGTGLGLAICHRIVAEHQGRLEVESAPGAGAVFSVRLPGAGGGGR